MNSTKIIFGRSGERHLSKLISGDLKTQGIKQLMSANVWWG